MPFGREQFRHQSPRAKTPPPHRAFGTPRPELHAVAPAAPASDNARHYRADQTGHTAPDTNGTPVESATDRSSHAAPIVAANPGGRPRRTPPTRRPPVSVPADGATRRVPGSGPYSRPAPGPKAANLLHPRRPTPVR